MNSEILRLVDTIHRDKEIDKEIIFQGIEAALLSAARKKLGDTEDARVSIDRETGEIKVYEGDREIDVGDLGRLAATQGKQVLFQKIREAERDRIYDEYIGKVGKLVSGVVQRMEGPNLIVNLGRVEGFLPRSEQSPGERFKVGERIKVLVKEVRKNTSRVKITLSRASEDLVRALFELEVPEVAEKVIEIKEIAREPGYRTKVAVTTYDHNVDCVGACVGVKGSRIKNIVDELFGEKIDIVRWNDSIEVLIMNALKPAEISSMDLDFEARKAIVYVKPDQQSYAIGRRGLNVRLASKLTGWDLDIVTVSDEDLEKLRREEVPQDEELSAEATLGAAAGGEETGSPEASGGLAAAEEAEAEPSPEGASEPAGGPEAGGPPGEGPAGPAGGDEAAARPPVSAEGGDSAAEASAESETPSGGTAPETADSGRSEPAPEPGDGTPAGASMAEESPAPAGEPGTPAECSAPSERTEAAPGPQEPQDNESVREEEEGEGHPSPSLAEEPPTSGTR